MINPVRNSFPKSALRLGLYLITCFLHLQVEARMRVPMKRLATVRHYSLGPKKFIHRIGRDFNEK